MISTNHRVWLLAAILAGAAGAGLREQYVSDPSFESGTPNSYTETGVTAGLLRPGQGRSVMPSALSAAAMPALPTQEVRWPF
jgi:hypothetical protein